MSAIHTREDFDVHKTEDMPSLLQTCMDAVLAKSSRDRIIYTTLSE